MGTQAPKRWAGGPRARFKGPGGPKKKKTRPYRFSGRGKTVFFQKTPKKTKKKRKGLGGCKGPSKKTFPPVKVIVFFVFYCSRGAALFQTRDFFPACFLKKGGISHSPQKQKK